MPMPGVNLHETYDESDTEDDEEQRTLFCANLDERVTEELLYEVFLQAGPIESARIPKDHNGRQRTFGFITYVYKCTVPYAMLLYQGLSLYRKTLNIKSRASTQPSPMRNHNSPGCSNRRTTYDNSTLRDGNYVTNKECPHQNPFRDSDTKSLVNYQVHISKHASYQRKSYTNNNPYQKSCTGSGDRNRGREKDRNKRRHNNNGSSRHSDQRSGGKNCR